MPHATRPLTQVYVVGVGSTPFRRWPDRTLSDLAREAITQATADAALEPGAPVDHVAFGNCAMDAWGQSNIRGQVCLDPLMATGLLPPGVPIVNVEAGCATGSAAFHAACTAVASGQSDLSLAIGVEKTFVPGDPGRILSIFDGGIDRVHPEVWQRFLTDAAVAAGERFEPHPHRIVFLDVHALQARHHMRVHGTTLAHLGAVAAKNHAHGALNPKAQIRVLMSADEVLADRPVVAPLTRSMCAPISDGAAAVLVASARWLAGQPTEVRDRAIAVRATALAGGTWRGLDEPGVTHRAAERAFARAGLRPADVDVAEVHDATAWCEIAALEALGFCEPGQGGPLGASGATARDGARPINTSGGLEAKGHPLGATGLGMIDELVTQLRGEAGERQIARPPTIALQHNAGGLVGFDEALCAVTLLERVR